MPAIQDWHTTGKTYTKKPNEELCMSRSLGVTLELASHQHAVQNLFEEPLPSGQTINAVICQISELDTT